MKNEDKLGIIKVVLASILIIVLLVVILKNRSMVSSDILNVFFDKECFLLEEDVFVSYWDELEVSCDGKVCDKAPTIYGNITWVAK